MDNQQERLAWLAGIIDGEGSISLILRPDQNKKVFKPVITIVNTDRGIINKCKQIFDELNVGVWIQLRKFDKYYKNSQDIYQMTISGIKRFHKIAPYIIPNLSSVRKEKVQIIYDWCSYRLTIPNSSLVSKKQYTDKDWEFYSKWKNAKILRDYMPDSL